MNLPKIRSVTKKIFVAFAGSFLLLFLLFHASANLLILRHDEGAWYSDFCHFMGSNWVVKVFEWVLFAVIALHMVLTIWLAITNRMARPVPYHKPQKSKTHRNSKLMMWTGIAIFLCMLMHFYDFYFVKLGWVKGNYMVKVENIKDGESVGLAQLAQEYDMPVEDLIGEFENEYMMYASEAGAEEEMQAQLEMLREKAPIASIINRAQREGNVSADGKWYRHLTYDERQTLKQRLPESKPEPDFYYMAREKFSHLHIVLGYYLFFLAVFMHLRHAFPSAFQTLGLNGSRYNNVIEVCGKVYTWLVTLMFTAVPTLVYLGL